MNERLFIFASHMRLRDENKQQAIRDKAIEMIVKEGLEGFGVNKLAKAAGISPGTIYIYYQDKEELILKLCLEKSANILEASLKNVHPAMSFAEGLKLQWENRYAFFKQYPLDVQFVEQVRYSPLYHSVTQMLSEKYGEQLGNFINGAIQRQELIPLPFEVYWSLAFAPLYQLINFHTQVQADGKKRFAISDVAFYQTLSSVIKGLTP
jgi:AcrR family transcriptional regulator